MLNKEKACIPIRKCSYTFHHSYDCYDKIKLVQKHSPQRDKKGEANKHKLRCLSCDMHKSLTILTRGRQITSPGTQDKQISCLGNCFFICSGRAGLTIRIKFSFGM